MQIKTGLIFAHSFGYESVNNKLAPFAKVVTSTKSESGA